MVSARFDTRTIMTCAAIGVAGVVFLLPAYYVVGGLVAVLPVLAVAAHGLFYVPSVIALALLRRPGVGLLASTIGGLICVALTPLGWFALVFQVIGGVEVEVPFLVMRYRRWGPVMCAVGAGIVGLGGAVEAVVGTGARSSVVAAVGFFALAVVSTALYGWLAWSIARGLRRAGVGPAELPDPRQEQPVGAGER